jgi:hypothetical protein
MHGVKPPGQRPMARDTGRRAAELPARLAVLNRSIALGIPVNGAKAKKHVCGCPLFGKHDLRSFGGVFDRTCVRPLIVAFDDATGGSCCSEGWVHIGSDSVPGTRAPGLYVLP